MTARFLLVALAAGLFTACSPANTTSAEPPLVERSHTTMGSELRLTAVGHGTSERTGLTSRETAIVDEDRILAAFEAVFKEVDHLDAVMSVWKPGSEILQLNAAAGEHPVPVGAEMREVLTTAREVSELTDGKFDITFGALGGLWKFDAQNQDNSIPTRADIERRLPFIDYHDVVVNAAAGTAFVKRKGVTANLGGIGKGYAVDRAAAILRQAGLRDFMIQFGGDLYLAGRRGSRPWRAAIRDPRGPVEKTFAALDLSDETFSTSGDYERFFMADGKRYHHIIDPDSGEPAHGCRSVTLVVKRAVIADALAKGVFILGPEKGMALIERLPDVEGVIVSDRNAVLVSSGLKARLTMLAPPTDAP
jgi:thiamine biosynthesis lipoprotein